MNLLKKLIHLTKFAFKIALEVESINDVNMLSFKIMNYWVSLQNE